jgi:hypothetical protein
MPGEDDKQDDFKHKFKTDEDFLKAAGSRFDGKVKSAAKEAREAATKEFLDALGIEDPSKIAEIKEKLSLADTSSSELDRVKAEGGKTARELKKAQEQVASLLGFKQEVLRTKAIEPHLAKIHPDHREVWRDILVSRASVLDDDKVVIGKGTDAKDPAEYVEQLIKDKPIYKAPDYKSGAGTKGNGGKSDAKGDDKPVEKEAPKDIRSAVRQSLAEQSEARKAQEGSGGP